MSDASASATPTAKPAKQPETLLGRYYTNLMFAFVISVMVFLLLQCVLEVFNLFDGGTRNYSVSGSPFHITSNWPWSVKAGFWLMGALMVEAKVMLVAAIAGPVVILVRKRFWPSSSAD